MAALCPYCKNGRLEPRSSLESATARPARPAGGSGGPGSGSCSRRLGTWRLRDCRASTAGRWSRSSMQRSSLCAASGGCQKGRRLVTLAPLSSATGANTHSTTTWAPRGWAGGSVCAPGFGGGSRTGRLHNDSVWQGRLDRGSPRAHCDPEGPGPARQAPLPGVRDDSRHPPGTPGLRRHFQQARQVHAGRAGQERRRDIQHLDNRERALPGQWQARTRTRL